MPRDADAATGTKEVGETDVVCGFLQEYVLCSGGEGGKEREGGVIYD